MKNLKYLVLSLAVSFFVYFLKPTTSLAFNDPLSVANNKFGIHIVNEQDLDNAAKLVNSSRGDWGYVTLVITESERDHDRWQKVFDSMRRLHLIPIVRIATKADGNNWEIPQEAEINNWVAFLNSLNWVIQNRYIVIGNEPNRKNEWGGKVDPVGYATYLKSTSQKLKSASSDFFILPAGLDPAQNETGFINAMIKYDPEIFNYIDGWTSHPYPSSSLTSYVKELNLVGRDLPVFITETGWPSNKYSEDEISQKTVSAYENEWNDPKIAAVTPFILNYTQNPYDIYSWEKKDGTFYKVYTDIQKIQKTSGKPTQIEKGEIVAAGIQPIIITGSDFIGAIIARNTGESIWKFGNVSIGDSTGNIKLISYSLKDIEPTKLGLIFFRGVSPQNAKLFGGNLFIKGSKGQAITNSFLTEAVVTNFDKQKIMEFFSRVLSFRR